VSCIFQVLIVLRLSSHLSLYTFPIDRTSDPCVKTRGVRMFLRYFIAITTLFVYSASAAVLGIDVSIYYPEVFVSYLVNYCSIL